VGEASTLLLIWVVVVGIFEKLVILGISFIALSVNDFDADDKLNLLCLWVWTDVLLVNEEYL
jgi:hypothetical protein